MGFFCLESLQTAALHAKPVKRSDAGRSTWEDDEESFQYRFLQRIQSDVVYRYRQLLDLAPDGRTGAAKTAIAMFVKRGLLSKYGDDRRSTYRKNSLKRENS